MSKSKYFPFFCASIAMHVSLGGILFFSSSPKQKQKKLSSFKERTISLPLESNKSCQTQIASKCASPTVSHPSLPQQTIKSAPSPKKLPPPKLLPPQSQKHTQKLEKPHPSLKRKQAALKKLAHLANQLVEEAESQQSHLEYISWSPQVEVSTEILSSQQEIFCSLFQQYVSLPFPGEVRLKLEISKEGSLLNCCILSTISDADKQHILNQIQRIPFQSFFNSYKTSKNIVFHIRLQGNSA